MAKTEPKNERAICGAVAKYLADRRSEQIVRIEGIDAVVRDRPAVECIYHTATIRFAVEHTRIESFPNQIAEGKHFAYLLGPLEAQLNGKLPGVYFLTVDVGAVHVAAANHEQVRAALATWIIDHAAALDPEEGTGPAGKCEISATPTGVPFEVTLHRDCDYGSQLLVMQGLVGDRQQQRRESIRRSLANKCHKLQAASGAGCESVLVLESDDVALASRVAVAKAVVAELTAREDKPDVIVWARTSTNPWKGFIIKDGDALYPDIGATLFVLRA
ncbi:MAG: hypothetical protein AB1411_16265 [Nitrospirota bacterium]